MEKEPAESPSTTFCKHAVAWVDLLSQKDALKKLRDMPETASEEPAFIEALGATFGEVRALRELFRRYYEERTAVPALPDWLPDDVRARMTELRQERVGLHGVSDAMALYVPLADDLTAATWDIQTLLYSCATMMLIALFRRQVMRGGIDIGIGGQVEPGEVYGPALSRAYLLESEEAEYPRILIGDELVEFLLLTSVLEERDVEVRLQRRLGGSCLDMITVDDDGKRVLHYLSNSQRHQMLLALKPDVVKAELTKGYEFVVGELTRFQREGNGKHATRYRRLKGYFDAYLPFW